MIKMWGKDTIKLKFYIDQYDLVKLDCVTKPKSLT